MSTEMEKETVQKLSAVLTVSQQTKFGLAVHDVTRIKDLAIKDEKVKITNIMTKGKAFYHYNEFGEMIIDNALNILWSYSQHKTYLHGIWPLAATVHVVPSVHAGVSSGQSHSGTWHHDMTA